MKASRYSSKRAYLFLVQVKSTFKSFSTGELAVRAQKQTLEKIRRNIAGKPALLKTSEMRMVRWLKEYKGTGN